MTNEVLIHHLTKLRQATDYKIKLIDCLFPSPQVEQAKEYLLRCLSWLGKLKGYAGSVNPYPQSTNSANKVIEKRADTAEQGFKKSDIEKKYTQLELTKSLRFDLDELVNSLRDLLILREKDKFYQIFVTQAYVSAIDSKLQLGWEMNRINNSLTKSLFTDCKINKMIEELGSASKSTKKTTKTDGGKKTTGTQKTEK